MMRMLGYILIGVGFIAGALAAVQTSENTIVWTGYLPGLLISATGVALARIAGRRDSHGGTAMASDMETVQRSIASIVTSIDRLEREKESINVYELPDRIDAVFVQDLNAFVEARQVIARAHGLSAYANVMNDFAAGERYLNRVWSASVDGYIDEAHTYIARSRDQFHRAHAAVDALAGGS